MLDNAVDSRQTEAGTLISLLRSEKRLEYLRLDFGVYARAGVGDSKHYVGARPRTRVIVSVASIEIYVGGLDQEFASVRHGVSRVDSEV